MTDRLSRLMGRNGIDSLKKPDEQTQADDLAKTVEMLVQAFEAIEEGIASV